LVFNLLVFDRQKATFHNVHASGQTTEAKPTREVEVYCRPLPPLPAPNESPRRKHLCWS